jgi:transmembrane sensor
LPYNDNLNNLIKNPSFIKWVKGKAAEDERLYWDEWLMESPANRSAALKAMQEIEGFSITPGENASTDEAWNALRNRIEKVNEPGIYRGLKKKRGRSGSLTWIVRVAAVALLGFISVYMSMQLYQAPAETVNASEVIENELVTDYGIQKKIRFSDGSEITLNGNSRLVTSNDSSNPDAINLYLEGEAYFSIARRDSPEDNPFRIQTEDGLVSVLGTKLVVSNRQGQTKVFLETGSVSVTPYHLDDETILEPGQFVGFDSNVRALDVQFVNPEIYTSWVNGRLYFEDAAVEEVLDQIEDTFGISAVVRDSQVFEYRISGSIESSELEIITSALSAILNISIEKSESDNVIYIGNNQE